MIDSNDRKVMGELIIQYLNEEIDFMKLAQTLPFDIELCNDSSVVGAFHALQHFEDDLDIRQEDEEYEALLRNELNKMAHTLCQGNSLEREERDFLEPKTSSLLDRLVCWLKH